jgi:deoxyribodipyrimidine photolyase-related protein
VEKEYPNRFGSLENFHWSVDRDGALEALEYFVGELLPRFGDFQDAMVSGEATLYHSLLSPYINAGLLGAVEVCARVEQAYTDGDAPINAVEGYIRQIIGWREYVRGIYWMQMPGYEDENFFGATRDLPKFYWDADTKMACVREAVEQTRDNAYAHHIQRLMVTGNFALLAGIDPKQVHEWYLAVYADAYEWVELPNTLGMSQFGDGGLLASKPYASSGNYINKMSNYCSSCHYKVKEKTGEEACPFNALYWHFMESNRDVLENNPRIGFAYRTLDKMGEEKVVELRASADAFLDGLESADAGEYL